MFKIRFGDGTQTNTAGSKEEVIATIIRQRAKGYSCWIIPDVPPKQEI